MTDKILIDRSVVEQALKALEKADRISGYRNNWAEVNSLIAALAQPQVEQETVGEAGSMPGTDGFTMVCFRASDVPVGTKLYTHPQPKRKPLTDQVRGLIASMVAELRAHRCCGDCYPENGWPEVNKVLAEYTAFKRVHGIGGEA